jgi:hypothetical protein
MPLVEVATATVVGLAPAAAVFVLSASLVPPPQAASAAAANSSAVETAADADRTGHPLAANNGPQVHQGQARRWR